MKTLLGLVLFCFWLMCEVVGRLIELTIQVVAVIFIVAVGAAAGLVVYAVVLNGVGQ